MKQRPDHRRRGTRAFTLIELLVVIAIMGVLASLVVGLSAYASRRGKEGRVRAEHEKLVTAIEAYKARIGYYPPDNGINKVKNAPKDATTNQLYYELSGTYLTNNNRYQTLDGRESIAVTDVTKFFRAEGFVNASTDPSQVRNYIPWLKASQYHEVSRAPDVELLRVPVDWPRNRPNPGPAEFNPWRYVSSGPTNNPKTFDLWAEFYIGGKLRVIGNWKE